MIDCDTTSPRLSSADAVDAFLSELVAISACMSADGHTSAEGGLSASTPWSGSEGEQLALLEELERVKSAVAAAQVEITASFVARESRRLELARSEARRERQTIPRPALSIGAQVGLARHQSPARGRRFAEAAVALVRDLPHTLAALAKGDIDEERAMVVVRETQDLAPDDRRSVDAGLLVPRAEDRDLDEDGETDESLPGSGRLFGMGPEALRQAVLRLAFQVDEDARSRRMRRARAERRVTGRLLSDGTGRLTAVLPREHYAAVLASLGQAATAAKASGDPRTREQLRADILVGRLTGQDTTRPLPIAVNLVMSVESLFGHSDEPGYLHGLTCGSKTVRSSGRGAVGGFVPAGLCADLIMAATSASRASLRRLFTAPEDDELVAMDSKARFFDWQLATMINLRDGGVCRTPWCDAPIREIDHVLSFASDGDTSLANGQGLCQACNLGKETPGWTTSACLTRDGGHEVTTVTPHDHVHTSHPPPLPRPRHGQHHQRGTPIGLRWSSLDGDDSSGPGPAEIYLTRQLIHLSG